MAIISLRRRTAVLNTVTGKTLVGELALTWPWQYKMRTPDIVDGPSGQPTRADGFVIVPRRVVEYVQIAD